MHFTRCIQNRNSTWLMLSSVTLLFIFVVYSLNQEIPAAVNENQIANDEANNEAADMKIILFWTRWYGKNNGFDFGYGSDIFQTCPVSNCLTTDDRKLFNQSRAVLFHVHPADFHISDLPGYRFDHQRFVMYFFEPVIFSDRQLFQSAPAHFFNWTFSWRRFSDVASNQYGDYRLKPHSFERRIVGPYEQEESLDDFYGVNITGKSITAAWFSSHCPTPVGREDYVAELQKHIRVDVYGSCGNWSCPKEKNRHESAACDQVIGRDYLFYLAFENSMCPDYVTEKLYRPLRSGAVPIVFGAAHYSKFAPPHSYVNALDFASPKHLADYLVALSNNRRLYAHYLEWRRHFQVVENPIDGWCQLCQDLNDDTKPAKSYADMAHWWFDYYPCHNYRWQANATLLHSV